MKQEKMEPYDGCSDEFDNEEAICNEGGFIVADYASAYEESAAEDDSRPTSSTSFAPDDEGLKLPLVIDTDEVARVRLQEPAAAASISNECRVCRKMLSSAHALQKHEMGHSCRRPHVCAQCGKGFVTRFNLHRHSLAHSGERPFACETCGRGFLERGHLLVHQRIHSGERPYKCSYCELSFAHKPHVTEHERIHSGQRPYKCSHCDKTFKRQTHRRGHEEKMHKVGIAS